MKVERIFDFYCGAGAASWGYHLAFPEAEILGIDINPQPNYPFEFVQADVLDWDEFDVQECDFAHASPPCQALSKQTADRSKHVNLIPQTMQLLIASGVPFVVENVEGAKEFMDSPVRLCGSSFGLDVQRHRYFKANWPLTAPPCDHGWQTPRFRSLNITNHRAGKLARVVGVHGHINYPGEFELRCKAMGVDWMTNDELVQAIPPAYTEYIGHQLAAWEGEIP